MGEFLAFNPNRFSILLFIMSFGSISELLIISQLAI